MKVRDHSPQFWFLFEDGEALYLEVNCSHSAVGYDFMIQMSSQEVTEYKVKGAAFLDSLAQEIQESAPGVASSKSHYKRRAASVEVQEKTQRAVACWKSENNTK